MRCSSQLLSLALCSCGFSWPCSLSSQCLCFPPLPGFGVRQNRWAPCVSSSGTPERLEQAGTVMWIRSALLPLEARTRVPHWDNATIYKMSAAQPGKGVVKVPEIPCCVSVAFHSILYSFCCCKPLTVFQSSDQVGLTVSERLFFNVCGGMGIWRCLLCHFADVTP